MFVLDTNVLSELMKLQPDLNVAHWASRQPKELIFTTSISKAEMLAGVALMPLGRRRTAFGRDVDRIFSLFQGPLQHLPKSYRQDGPPAARSEGQTSLLRRLFARMPPPS